MEFDSSRTLRFFAIVAVSLWAVLCAPAWLSSPSLSAAEPGRQFNRLADEQSPYLRQHADNPIWWYPWGREAFRAAREQNKPIFLSIGYSSCHWCHVMSGESFSNAEVAAAMNAGFVAILVDREERPDVDQAYTRAVQAMIGSSGWPLTLFLTPDGRPFMGATFIPRRRLLRLLHQFQEIWARNPRRIEEIGQQVAAHLQQEAAVGFSDAALPDEDALRAFFHQASSRFDPQYGGFGSGSKFLPAMELSLLLRIAHRTGSERALHMVTQSLDAIARGGVHDQLGGGFHRYAVDRQWRIPHFEKMLPENALLAVAYLEAFQVTRNLEYEAVVRGILDYVLREMTHPQGGFFSSQDADSERTEGRFYAWTLQELRDALPADELKAIENTYHVTPQGNYNPALKDVEEKAGLHVVRGGNILYLDALQRLPVAGDRVLWEARRKLLLLRDKRIRPHRDEKIVGAWNGLMISAFAKGYQVLGSARYLTAARRAARFVLDNLRDSRGRLFRHWLDGQPRQAGFLNDYAFVVRALLDLYQSNFDPSWITAALALQELQDRDFWDDGGGNYNFARDSEPALLTRNKVFVDDSIPSGNAVAARNLLQIADLTLQWKLRKRAARIISSIAAPLGKSPMRYPYMLAVLDYLRDKSKEVAVIGAKDAPSLGAVVRYLHRDFLPNKVMAVGAPAPDEQQWEGAVLLLAGKPLLRGQPTTYVCENNICRLPTTDLKTVRELVGDMRTYELGEPPRN